MAMMWWTDRVASDGSRPPLELSNGEAFTGKEIPGIAGIMYKFDFYQDIGDNLYRQTNYLLALGEGVWPKKGGDVLVVTRHTALIQHLAEIGLIESGAIILDHVTPDQVAGRHVIGVLPLHLASLASSVTEVPLMIPSEMRGRELTLAEIRRHAGPPVTYQVTRLGTKGV